jgi:hypothetical protein
MRANGIRVERRDACDACEWDAYQSYVYGCGLRVSASNMLIDG